MALGRRNKQRQAEFWVATQQLPTSPGHVFYENLDGLLAEGKFDEWVEESLLRERLLAALSELFGGLALVLTAAGLFGVISYMAARRAQEIGIRVALGASRSVVIGLILRETAVLLLVGLSAGALLALAGGRATSGLLFGLQSSEPLLLLIAAATLSLVAAVASCLPAWRAARVNPVCALRQN